MLEEGKLTLREQIKAGMPRWTPADERLGLSASLDMLELTRFVG